MALLTTKQVQELFKVDKSTIYRMAEDGRIPAVKVGRQWRFPSEKLDGLLGGAAPSSPASPPSPAPPTGSPISLQIALPAETAEALSELVADLFGVMAVVTDMQGNALTSVANPCGYFSAVSDGPYTADQCAIGWRRLGEEIDLEPQFLVSHLGFLCARSFIRVGNALAGMIIVGGVTPPSGAIDPATLETVAAEISVPLSVLETHAPETYDLDADQRLRILRMLPRITDLISRLAGASDELLSKLDVVSGLAGATHET
jgi:excisionase family DNA binding protein